MGTAEQPIILTSYGDDMAGGDTFGDGATAGRPGDWESLIFTGEGSHASRLEHVRIRYAGNLYGPSDSANYNRAAVYLIDSNATLKSVRLDNVRFYGVRIENGTPVLDGVHVEASGSWPFYMNLKANPTLLNITATGGPNHGLVIDRGTFEDDRTWDITTMPYVLTGGSRYDNGIAMTLPAGRRLTIAAGVIVKSANEMVWNIQGTLLALGTVDQPVIFTSYQDDLAGGDSFGDGSEGTDGPRPGNWESLIFSGHDSDLSRLENVILRYAGNLYGPADSASYNRPAIVLTDSNAVLKSVRLRNVRGMGIRIENGRPTLDGVDVQASGDWPFYMNLATNPVLNGITASGGKYFGLVIDRGTFNEDRVWDILTMPYVLTGGGRYDNGIGMIIPAERTLTVKPGVVIKSAGEMFWQVNGTLSAIGTPELPIVFTHYDDDSVGGDSFGDGSTGGALARPGAWENIVIDGDASGSSRLEHVAIRYAGNKYGAADSASYNVPALRLTNTTAKVQTVRIQDVRGIGVRIEDGAPTVTGVEVERSGDWPFYMNLAANPVLSGITASQTKYIGLVVDRGTFTGDRVWDITSMPYVLTGGGRYDNGIAMILPADLKLTIQPGVVVKSANEMYWQVNGTLAAVGTAQRPVIFTGYDDDTVGGDSFADGMSGTEAPRPGDWENIVLAAGSNASRLEHVEIRYAGNRYSATDGATHNQPAIKLTGGTQATLQDVLVRDVRGYGIRIEDSAPTLTRVHVQDGGDWPYYLNLGASPIWSEITAAGSRELGILVDWGTLVRDLIWDNTTLPYVITGGGRYDNGISMIIPETRKLTIQPGVVVKSANEMFWQVDGVLDAAGTAGRPIIFTSWQDDLAGGDSFADGASTAPRPGDWEGIILNSGVAAGTRLNHVTIRYAGNQYSANDSASYNRPALTVGSELSSTGLVVEFNRAAGVQVLGTGNLTLAGSLIASNGGTGIQVDATAKLAISGSVLVELPSGIGYAGTQAGNVTARGNWWGHAGGPHHPTGVPPLNNNPSGTAVGDFVDFSDWLATAPAIRGGASVLRLTPGVQTVLRVFQVVFDGPMDATTFGVPDVSVTDPSGISLEVASVVAVSANVFEIRLTSRATAAGNYTVRVGPDIQTRAGVRMDQNGNATPGEVGDAFSGTIRLDQSGPQVASQTPSGRIEESVTSLSLRFNEPVRVDSLPVERVGLYLNGAAEPIRPLSIRPIQSFVGP